jgi:hypothetical protein
VADPTVALNELRDKPQNLESMRYWVVGNKSKELVSCEFNRFNIELISESLKRFSKRFAIYTRDII